MRDTIGHLCNIKLYWDVCATGTYRMLTVFIDVFMSYFQVYVVTYFIYFNLTAYSFGETTQILTKKIPNGIIKCTHCKN